MKRSCLSVVVLLGLSACPSDDGINGPMTDDEDLGTTSDGLSTSSTAPTFTATTMPPATTSGPDTSGGPSSAAPTTDSGTESGTESDTEAEAEAESETTEPGTAFSLLGFGMFVDDATGYVFTDGELVSAETVDVPFHVTAAVKEEDQYYVLLREKTGAGGLVNWPHDVTLEELQEPQTFAFSIDAPNQYRGAAVSNDYVLFTSPTVDPLACDRTDPTACQDVTTPQLLLAAACSDDGTCVAGGSDPGTMRSVDGGLTWTNLADNRDPSAVVAGPGGTYAIRDFGTSAVAFSNDGGQTWADATTPAGADNVIPFVYFAEVFAGGQFNFKSTGIFTSANGSNWVEHAPAVASGISGAVIMPEIEVALFLTSNDTGFIIDDTLGDPVMIDEAFSQRIHAAALGSFVWLGNR